ncbi:MAG: chromate transporter [Oscillibacter sp.]|nr:chromate transporter [Oscillibacter sp.]
MIYLQLFWEFFKTGLFAVGGGMATLPFLQAIGESTGWYTYTDLMNMLAVSESTPGPIGINMATYVGFTAAGVPGAVIATLGEVTPSIIVILIVAAVLHSFRNNRYVDQAFYGLRPASTGLIGAACVSVILEVLTSVQLAAQEGSLVKAPAISLDASAPLGGLFSLPGLALAALLLVLTNWVPKVKGLHPIVFIALSAAVGIVFGFAGA